MKKLIAVAIVFCTIAVNAQEKKRNWETFKKEQGLVSKNNMKPQDRALLESKKLTLKLDLSAEQQSKVEAVLLAHFKEGKAKRDAMKKSRKQSDEERLAMRNEMLDSQIALKKEMKLILDADQYTRYEQLQRSRHQRSIKKVKEKQRR